MISKFKLWISAPNWRNRLRLTPLTGSSPSTLRGSRTARRRTETTSRDATTRSEPWGDSRGEGKYLHVAIEAVETCAHQRSKQIRSQLGSPEHRWNAVIRSWRDISIAFYLTPSHLHLLSRWGCLGLLSTIKEGFFLERTIMFRMFRNSDASKFQAIINEIFIGITQNS